ncbi:hypothetical protein FGIG_07855 [Fasciola gigantica]|uniref:Uncharacterized protein n=1 Tax=Fasciola gigantica TaxID=46835 RepID=A0A504Y817_FASGI|nr:hypothetical protein FGIG_07854 [Fasciola gigantica]TPP56275.1 hypothetical protein FGIG_07855 [Fasciola gigantica]
MKLAFVLLICLLRTLPTSSITCRDEQGNSVDWFVGYKLPKSFKYVYLTPNTSEWKLSKELVTDGGMLRKTYNDMFQLKNRHSAAYGMYNDQLPKDEYIEGSSEWGHLKGGVSFPMLYRTS